MRMWDSLEDLAEDFTFDRFDPEAYNAATTEFTVTKKATGEKGTVERSRDGKRWCNWKPLVVAGAIIASTMVLGGCYNPWQSPINCAGTHIDPACYGGR